MYKSAINKNLEFSLDVSSGRRRTLDLQRLTAPFQPVGTGSPLDLRIEQRFGKPENGEELAKQPGAHILGFAKRQITTLDRRIRKRERERERERERG